MLQPYSVHNVIMAYVIIHTKSIQLHIQNPSAGMWAAGSRLAGISHICSIDTSKEDSASSSATCSSSFSFSSLTLCSSWLFFPPFLWLIRSLISSREENRLFHVIGLFQDYELYWVHQTDPLTGNSMKWFQSLHVTCPFLSLLNIILDFWMSPASSVCSERWKNEAH